jgi:predicted nucleic acid-binding protein
LIYIDTSVILAHLLAEDRTPPDRLWSEPLVASRLLHYETWARIHARGLGSTHGDALRANLDRIAIVEMQPFVLQRALEPFPTPLRTLDALHLASIEFLRAQGQAVRLASYDDRLRTAARALEIPLFEFEAPPAGSAEQLERAPRRHAGVGREF